MVRPSGRKMTRAVRSVKSKKAKAEKPEKGGVGEEKKKKHKWKSGTVALREIKRFQGSGKNATKQLIQRAPFERLVREVAQDYKTDCRFQKDAIDALQEATEAFVTELMQSTMDVTANGGRQGIRVGDMRTAIHLRGWRQANGKR